MKAQRVGDTGMMTDELSRLVWQEVPMFAFVRDVCVFGLGGGHAQVFEHAVALGSVLD
jgi:hypothetical protein